MGRGSSDARSHEEPTGGLDGGRVLVVIVELKLVVFDESTVWEYVIRISSPQTF